MPQITITTNNLLYQYRNWEGDGYARQIHADGRPVHTFRTASVYVFGNHNTFRDCVFQNTAGRGEDVGQAIALYVDGDENRFENCVIEGHQDTLFLAPLPPKEYEKDGFLGPRQFAPRTPRTTYFKDCVIKGGVDFVFGGGTAYFDHCTFCSVEPGFVFAPSTPEEVETGFVCRDCQFVSDLPPESCYIARPWREYAAVTLENCELGAHIAAVGWHDWNKAYAHDTVRFAEIRSSGPGANPAARPTWVRRTC